jgi:hypothetical protein
VEELLWWICGLLFAVVLIPCILALAIVAWRALWSVATALPVTRALALHRRRLARLLALAESMGCLTINAFDPDPDYPVGG